MIIKCKSKEKIKGITLIALVITIIILLILSGITIVSITGENGLIGKAKWTKFVTEYNNVKEAVNIYTFSKDINKEENYYPIKENEKVQNNEIKNTLEETIKKAENINEITEEKVNLYKIDKEIIKEYTQKDYVINILTGEIYRIEGEKYEGKTYHRPEYGVTKDGIIDDGPQDTEDTIYLIIDESKQLTTKLNLGEVVWTTSDESIVIVDHTGKITGIAKGEATITISYKTEDTGDIENPGDTEEGSGTQGGEEEVTEVNIQTYKIIVEEGIPENFTLEMETEKEIGEYQTYKIEVKIEGKKIGTSYLEWESSDENIVKVNGKGEIKGLQIGEAIIKCKWKEDQTKEAMCRVIVKASDKLILDKTNVSVTIDQTVKLIAKYQEQNVTNTASWTSEDENVATIQNGQIKGIAIGTTTIIAEYQGERVICNVEVKDIVTEIYTIEDLSLFAKQVNSGIKYEGKIVELKNDLDFKKEESYESTESQEYKDYYISTDITANTWIRIGNSTTKYFNGTFEGNGNTITNLYMNIAAGNLGLFGYSNGGNFKNINLKDVNIISTRYQIGGLLGYGNNVNISNCKVSGNITTTGHTSNHNRTGGIVGLIGTMGGTINSCVNEATIGGSYHMKGGIVGFMYKGTITNCTNKGSVTSSNAHIGGIVGYAGYNSNVNYTVSIDNCKNYGEIQASHYVAGIAGVITQSTSIRNSTNYNSGSIKSLKHNGTTYYDSEAGGIVGLIYNKGDNIVENCNNYATITGSYNGVGGIIGTSMKGTVKKCTNQGIITGGRSGTGGITGRTGYYNTTRTIYTKSIVENCVNKSEGVVTSTGWNIGGISGYTEYGSEIRKANNYANVTGTGQSSNFGNVGGIVGCQSIYVYNKVPCLIEECNNYGDVKGSYIFCGGIVGRHRRGTIINCINEGNVTNEKNHTGGITGCTGNYEETVKTNGTIEGCINKGDVTITGEGATACNVGGISGTLHNGSWIKNCGNIGNISSNGYNTSADKTSRTGGIVGMMNTVGANKVTNCYNLGNVTAKYKYIGGITGYMYTGTAVIENSYSKGEITGPANIGGIVGYKRAGTVTESYYLENSVKPTEGEKTEEGEEKDESTINSLIEMLKKEM